MIYLTMNGNKYEADSAEELVSQLRESSFVATEDDADFMKKSADRAAVQSGHKVRHDDAASFVADLIKVGMLKVEKEEKRAVARNQEKGE